MAWITATTLDDRSANLQTQQIAAILERVPKRPQDGSVVILAGGGEVLEVKESPAELLRAADSEAESSLPQAGNIW